NRFQVLIHKYDTRTGTYRDFKPEDSGAVQKNEQSKLAWQLKKVLIDGESSELELFDKNLITLFRDLLKHYPYHLPLEGSRIFSPYEGIIMNWDMLEQESQKTGSNEAETTARADLKNILETLRQGSGDQKLDEYMKNRSIYRTNRTITFEALWTIFPPGSLVYSKPFMKQDQVFIVYDNVGPWPDPINNRSRVPPFELRCWTYDWDGEYFNRRIVRLTIEHFDLIKPISTLAIQPLDLMEGAEDIRQDLIARGKLFRKYATLSSDSRMLNYDGRAIFEKASARGAFLDPVGRESRLPVYVKDANGQLTANANQPTQVLSEVMVDFESYYKYAQPWSSIGKYAIDDDDRECECQDCLVNQGLQMSWRSRFDRMLGIASEEWEDLQYIICAPRVLGYVLREKTWAQLDVKGLKTIVHDPSDNAFMNRLKLQGPDSGLKTKELLLGLIRNHGIDENSKRSKEYELVDIVAEKGRGLVILLHGPPGVGKTSTAQTIAVAAGKPLLTVGVADVGTSAKNVERNLEKIFDLATAWKSVLLIDEADVFLQSRTRGELGPTTERNALVSVFLRVLEYYQGILILTTNQISQFDVAVQSRINIALKYESLDADQTIQIFNNFYSQFEKKNMVEPREKEAIKKWASTLARKKFDGRQIRNIVTSAIGLAKAADPPRKLQLDDLQDICYIMESFKGDLSYQMMQYESKQRPSPHATRA
ncbi:hypothetical protein Micbo1qcDRAFT_225735, partial [Microdochium bolleyi]